jgi:hypothetical protein
LALVRTVDLTGCSLLRVRDWPRLPRAENETTLATAANTVIITRRWTLRFFIMDQLLRCMKVRFGSTVFCHKKAQKSTKGAERHRNDCSVLPGDCSALPGRLFSFAGTIVQLCRDDCSALPGRLFSFADARFLCFLCLFVATLSPPMTPSTPGLTSPSTLPPR